MWKEPTFSRYCWRGKPDIGKDFYLVFVTPGLQIRRQFEGHVDHSALGGFGDSNTLDRECDNQEQHLVWIAIRC